MQLNEHSIMRQLVKTESESAKKFLKRDALNQIIGKNEAVG